ncbi:propanediol utilization protein [Candidatus Pacearchaeota archaeon]|nr:propanediol utilization protein [Candidatus Pacearchaeota archaeon]
MKETYMDKEISVGVSNRHVHLSAEHLERLFGERYKLKIKSQIRQPGQFAAEEKVELLGTSSLPARVVGPVRKDTQVEILKEDQKVLGIEVPERLSGDLEGSPGIKIKGPRGEINISRGVIIAAKHLHVSDKELKKYSLEEIRVIDIETQNGKAIKNVAVRSGPNHLSEFHIDKDDARLYGLENGHKIKINKRHP